MRTWSRDESSHPSIAFARFLSPARVVPERNDPEIREVIVGSFRVVYRHRTGVVEIATVFRASRLFPSIE